MSVPTFKLVFDRQKRASVKKEGSVELRITWNRIQRHVTTGVRVLPKQWRNGQVVNRLDALELQRSLDVFVAEARRTVNGLMERGELDMRTVVAVVGNKQYSGATHNVKTSRSLLDYMKERMTIRKYGRSKDSQGRYDRFYKWFESWGKILTFDDITEANILQMDEALIKRGLKTYSKWNNYHRFLNSFILDAIDDGLMQGNPYRKVNIQKDKSSGGIGKYLTRDEFRRIEKLEPATNYLRHARDLFVFQTYTCLSYTDLAAFDAGRIRERNGRKVYAGRRGKTGQEYVFLLLSPALRVLERYGGRLPIMSNVKYNEYLKVIAMACKINKPVSSHWARHTGATMLLNSGMDMEIVSKVLGHSSTRITREVYAKLLDTTVEDAMARMEKRLG